MSTPEVADRAEPSSAGDVGEDLIELLLIDGTELLDGGAIGVDNDERWMARNREVGEHIARIIADLLERERVLVDEALERCFVA